MKKYSVFTLVLLILAFISITTSAQTILSVLPTNPTCNGSTTGEVEIDIIQTSPATDVTVKLYWLNPITGFWINLGTSVGANVTFPFPNLGSGDYRVDLMNTVSGNLLDAEFFTLVDPSEFIANINSLPILCNGDDTDLSITTSGGTNPINSYTWSNGTIGISTIVLAGSYTCLVEDNNGCQSLASINLTQPAILQPAGFVSQGIIGFGNANGEITAQVTGGTPPYNYSINNGSFTTDPVFPNLSASTHLISYIDSNSCTISQNIILNNPVQLSGNISVLSPVTCNGACDGSIKFVNNNSGTPPYTFSLNGGSYQSSNIFNNLCGDSIYYITIMDSQNSMLVDSIYLTQPTPLVFSIFSSFLCNGGGGSISLSNPIGGNGAPISYSFDGGITFIQSWNQSVLQAGTYSLAIQDALGCITYDSTVLIEPLPITISTQVSDVSCNSLLDGSINIIASGGVSPFTYLWNNLATTNNIYNLPSGNYSVDITDGNGCTANTSEVISDPDVLLVTSVIIDNLIPFSSFAAINTNISGGTGAYTTTWDGPNNFSSTDSNIDSLLSGVYFLSVQDENLCIFLDTLEIIDPIAVFGCTDSNALNFNALSNINNGTCYYCPLNYSLVSLAPSSPFNCNGWIWASTLLGSNPINYFWSTGAPTTDFAIQNLCNDFYSLTIVDDNGCGADTTILLSNYVGCMDSLALNYDPIAMFDDNSCILFIYGCTDSLAANYNILANTDDTSCVPFILGCMDTLAINYNALADTIDGTCCYVSGCLDSTMFNYNILACLDTVLGGSCIPKIYGCTDDNAGNWNALANTDDGSCWNCNYGCMDSTMFNYDTSATCNQGCIPFVYGCIDNTALNYIDTANTDDGSCIAVVNGCTDSTAFNYNALANTDDNNCFSCSFPTPTWLIDTANISSCGASAALVISSINSGPLAYNWDVLWGSFCCIPTQYQSIDLCLGIYSMTVTDVYGCTFIDTIEIGNVVLGCTDSTAQNYNSNANIDDGSCCAAPIVDLTIGNWIFVFDWACPGNDTTYYINYNSNGTWLNSYSGLWQLCGDQYTHTYFNDQTVYTGIYSNGIITGTMTDGISNNIGCFSIYLDSSSVVFGCTDLTAFNYDPISTLDDGSCIPSVYGCSNPTACNYNLSVNVDDNSCVYISGCIDQSAINYDSLACIDDGSCVFPQSNCLFQSPTGIYISELINDRARINWDNMNDSNCMVNQYRIRYREIGTNVWSSKTMAGSGQCIFGLNTNTKVLLGLLPLTTYEFRIKAWYCGGGVSSWTADQNFTTSGLCLNVDNFAASTPTTTKATFTWDLPATAYSFARIKLRVDTVGSTWTTAGGFGVFSPAVTKNKNSLNPGTTYRASVRTWCDANGGPYRSALWSTPIFWTQPTSIRLEGGSAINNLSVYPNPSRDIFNVSFTSVDKQDLEVRVINVVGEVVYTVNLEQFIGEYTKQINLSDNAKGIYFIEIETNNGVINKKLILQ